MKPLTDDQRALVEDNMKLVPYMLNKCEIPYWKLRAEEDDLMQVGYLALCMAAAAYDSSQGKFSTYACTAIKNAILLEVRKDVAIQEVPIENENTFSFFREPDPTNLEETLDKRIFLERITDDCERVDRCAVNMVFARAKGYTISEVAKANNMSNRTAVRRISEAKGVLQMEYSNYLMGRMRA